MASITYLSHVGQVSAEEGPQTVWRCFLQTRVSNHFTANLWLGTTETKISWSLTQSLLSQIDTEKYVVGHQDEDCACSPITIDQGDLEKILANEDRFPLLRLTGDINDFSVTLVDSEDDALSTYVAISHVWADGLGNPRTNTLHPCKWKVRLFLSHARRAIKYGFRMINSWEWYF